MRVPVVIAAIVLLAAPSLHAQDWKQVHRADETKWAKDTGLDPVIIHKWARAAAHVPDENQDPSRIAGIDLEGLATRHDVLFVTYSGEKNCLTVTVFRQFSDTKFNKIWSADSAPDGTRFCDTDFGSARADAADGQVLVRVPHAVTRDGVEYTVYEYAWNGITYRLEGQKEVRPER